MWRPKDWLNPHPISLYYGTLPVDLHEIFEAGADAMFAAMMKEVENKFEYCDSAGDNFTGIGYFISKDEWEAKLKEWRAGCGT